MTSAIQPLPDGQTLPSAAATAGAAPGTFTNLLDALTPASPAPPPLPVALPPLSPAGAPVLEAAPVPVLDAGTGGATNAQPAVVAKAAPASRPAHAKPPGLVDQVDQAATTPLPATAPDGLAIPLLPVPAPHAGLHVPGLSPASVTRQAAPQPADPARGVAASVDPTAPVAVLTEAALPSAPGPSAAQGIATAPAWPDGKHDPSPAIDPGTSAPAATAAALPAARPPSHAAAPVAATPAGVANQLAPALVQLTHAASGNTVTLRLDPAGLGHVQVRIDRDPAGTATVQVTAEHPDTLRLLVADQSQLQRSLDSAGLPADGRTLNFSLATANGGAFTGGGDAGGGRRQASGRSARGADLDDDTGFAPQSAWQRAGVDITA